LLRKCKLSELFELLRRNTGRDSEEDDSEAELQKEIEEEEEAKKEGKTEDVRISNAAFAQTKMGEFTTMILSSIGIVNAIIASEMGFENSKG